METTVTGSTLDGHIYGNNATYTTARSTAAAAVQDSVIVGQRAGFYCYEGFVSFDVDAAVGMNYGEYVIDSVRLFMKPAAMYNATEFDIEAVTKDYSGGGTLTTADWVAGADIAGTVRFSINSASLAADAYEEFTVGTWEAAGLDTDGNIYLMLYSTEHKAGSEPTTNEYVAFYSGDTAGSEPYVIVTWHSILPTGGFLKGAVGPPAIWNRELSASEVVAAKNAGMVIYDRALDKGTATIAGPMLTRTGAVVPAEHVRAGWWIQHLDANNSTSAKPKPLLITGHSVDLESGRNSLTIGTDWMEDEIGVKMADLLAIPAPAAPEAEEEAAADPSQPESNPSADDAVWEGTYTEPEATYNAPLDVDPAHETDSEGFLGWEIW